MPATTAIRIGWMGLFASTLGIVAIADTAANPQPGAAAPDRVTLPAPGSNAWRPLEFSGIERRTRYSVESSGGRETLLADSNCAASGLVLDLHDVALSRTPWLSWSWLVEHPLDIADERSRRGDDFAARVYVMFRFDAAGASLFERIRHRLGRSLYGEAPGRALNFVWTSRERPGAYWDNPFAADAKMIALRQGVADGWRRETVDVREQYLRHFGAPEPALMGVAIMTDSDNSCQTARARFADFEFASRPGAFP